MSIRKEGLSSSLSKRVTVQDSLVLIQNLDQLLLFICSDPNPDAELTFSQEIMLDSTGTRIPIDAVFDQKLGELLLYFGLQLHQGDRISEVAVRRFARHLMLINEEFLPNQHVCSGVGSVSTYHGYYIVTLEERSQGAVPTAKIRAQKSGGEWKTLDITKGYNSMLETPSRIYVSTPSRNFDYIYAFVWCSETIYMLQLQAKYFENWLQGASRYWERNRLKTSLPISISSAVTLKDSIEQKHRLYIFWTEGGSADQTIRYGYFALRSDGSVARPSTGSVEILDVQEITIRPGSSFSGPALGQKSVARVAKGRIWTLWTQDHQPKCASLAISDDGALDPGLWTGHNLVLPKGRRERPSYDATWNALFVPPMVDP